MSRRLRVEDTILREIISIIEVLNKRKFRERKDSRLKLEREGYESRKDNQIFQNTVAIKLAIERKKEK